MTDFSGRKDPISQEKWQRIRLIVFDVDGVLTDGRLILSDSGEESKSFSIRDGLGIVLAQRSSLVVALMSGRRSPAVERRAKELGIPVEWVITGARDKQKALKEIKEQAGFQTEEIAFVGDDLNDLPAFEEAGMAVAVADAAPELLERAEFVTQNGGGQGAAREVIEAILQAQGRWDEAVTSYLEFLKSPSVEAPSPQ